MGVAVDSAGNVYIADTGNNRVVKVNATTGVQTVLGKSTFISGGAAPGSTVAQYQFGAFRSGGRLREQRLRSDTGQRVIVEIPYDIDLGGAAPLFSYPGAPTFVTPVAVAVDSKGFVYVADQGNPSGEVVRIPPGGDP